MNKELMKNFEMMRSSTLLDDPRNQKYFGKKENMVSVSLPFTSEIFTKMDRFSTDCLHFFGGFKKVTRIPFWVKTYEDKDISLRRFEKRSLEDSFSTKCLKRMTTDGWKRSWYKDSQFDEYLNGNSKTPPVYDDVGFLPESMGLTFWKDNDVEHKIFYDKDFGCFLWFYYKK